jgi:hypothetical protein
MRDAEMNFTYELINAEHLTEDQIAEIEDSLYRGAYCCQQDFERQMDLGHPINVLPDAVDEAYVSSIEFNGDDVYVELDCNKVRF